MLDFENVPSEPNIRCNVWRSYLVLIASYSQYDFGNLCNIVGHIRIHLVMIMVEMR